MLLIAALTAGALSFPAPPPFAATPARPKPLVAAATHLGARPPHGSRHRHAHLPSAHHASFRSPTRVTVPRGAPRAVRRAIAAANRITGRPYVYGGGHGSFVASGYDCSGTVSYALHGAGLVGTPMASGDLASYGKPGKGRWITIYANAGHAWMTIAGRRLDTSATNDPGGRDGPLWRRQMASTNGFVVRHPSGL